MPSKNKIELALILLLFLTPPISGLSENNVQFFEIKNISVKRGSKDLVTLSVKNNGPLFLNYCKIDFNGLASRWISNKQEKGLSPGEKTKFFLDIDIPREAQTGTYIVNIFLRCEEGEFSEVIYLEIYQDSVEINFLQHAIENNILKINYRVEELTNKYNEIEAHYSLVGLDGIARSRAVSYIPLAPLQKRNITLSLELPKDSLGEFDIFLHLKTKDSDTVLVSPIFIPSKSPLTGSAISALTNPIKKITRVWILIPTILIMLLTLLTLRKKLHKRKLTIPRQDTQLIKTGVIKESSPQ